MAASTTSGSRWWRAVLATAVLAVTYLLASPAGVSFAKDKIDPELVNDLATGDGTTTFWVELAEKADVSRARAIRDRAERGRYVVKQLTTAAERSQAGLRGLLRGRGVEHRAYWAANVVKVSGDRALVDEIARRTDVAALYPTRRYEVPRPVSPGTAEDPRTEAGADGVEWNIDRVRAPEVWSTYGARGEGIVVGVIDTGVQYDHPALIGKYRGNRDGTVDHNYSWYDPTGICGPAPCDRDMGHGTHVTGTVLGDDGTNRIGVAPNARWIAARGCEVPYCSDEALIASGQWMLAPTDLNGENPRPDLRPHVINNSWGGDGGQPFYQQVVDAWVASGIFPLFANGNHGPHCDTTSSPADYLNSYSVGNFDVNNVINATSSKGPGRYAGELKPNIAAPGTDIRSSFPDNRYVNWGGTSMATPHVAGTVALLWSMVPELARDIPKTRELLDVTAADSDDQTCGGTAEDNNVFGEGRLDAFDATLAAVRAGALAGSVTDAADGTPIAGVAVEIEGTVNRSITTGADGSYRQVLPDGTYQVTVSRFGYPTRTVTGVVVAKDQTTTRDFALQRLPTHPVSGYVRDAAGAAIPHAIVTVDGATFPSVTTDGSGFYRFPSVPEGEQDLRASLGGCYERGSQRLEVAGAQTHDFTLPARHDGYGYGCRAAEVDWLPTDTELDMRYPYGSELVTVDLPFEFTFYGRTYQKAGVVDSGYLSFTEHQYSVPHGVAIPTSARPNAAVYAFWDNVRVDDRGAVRTGVVGAAPDRKFVVEWRNVKNHPGTVIDPDPDKGPRVDVQLVLSEKDGSVLLQYRSRDDDAWSLGSEATIGIEDHTGTVALPYSHDEASLAHPEFAVRYGLPAGGFVKGAASAAHDGSPVAGASVKAIRDGEVVRRTVTAADGRYVLHLPLGRYRVEVDAPNYDPTVANLRLDAVDESLTRDFTLHTGHGELDPAVLELTVPAGQKRTTTVTLSNTGTGELSWKLGERGGDPVAATTTTEGLERNPDYDPASPTTKGMFRGTAPSGASPSATGDVLRSWAPEGLAKPWGIGMGDDLWLSEYDLQRRNHEFTPLGAPTGRTWAAEWAGTGDAWAADMAYDSRRGLMCQLAVNGSERENPEKGIYCWDPDSGEIVDSIIGGDLDWTRLTQRGLAYRPDTDTFYVGGWVDGPLYHVKGLSHPDKGAVISACWPTDPLTSGLAWNANEGVLWQATNSETDTVYALNPETCEVLDTLAHPDPGYSGAGLELDSDGNLWMVSQKSGTVLLVDSGLPASSDVGWLSVRSTSGDLAPGSRQRLMVTIDTTGLKPGVYAATVFLDVSSARQPTLRLPVRVTIRP